MVSMSSVDSLAAAMVDEIACLENYIEGQKAFAEALRARNWQALQDRMEALGGISQGLAKIEEDRAVAESILREEAQCEAGGFYRLALLIQEPERTKLTDIYRKLKISAMRAKFENSASGDYAEGNHMLLGAVLEELFPEKRGRIYGRSGHAVSAGHDALLLNTAL
jgi:hypothetical protein